MKFFLNKFFHDVDLSPFYKLFETIFNEKIYLGTIEDSDILFESVFGTNTLLYHKKWLYTFLFIGESDRRLPLFIPNGISNNTLKDYSCILKGEKDNNNIINFPLFVFYTYCFNFTQKLIKHNYDANRWNQITNNIITKIPPKNVCVIISSADSEGRNYFCEQLEKVVKIDYAGSYKKNVPNILDSHCSPGFIDFVSQYKIIITMENSKNKTYITEKILHGFAANTIPVYWGSDNINEYFNEERFINVKSFNNNDINKAINEICILLNDNKKYLEMVNKPIYINNRIPLTINNISNNIQKLLNITCKQRKHFITFGGPTSNYHNSVIRICEEAKDINVFDEITGFTEADLKTDTCFWEKHCKFIESNGRGFGYWIWKPYLIQKELEKLNDNDILIYCDAGCQINKNGRERLLEYIDLLNTNKDDYGIISFQLEFKELLYTKQKIFEHFNCDENSKNKLQCLGGIQIIRKNCHSISIINEWCNASCKYDLINDKLTNEHASFVENRHDQSILSLLTNKCGSIKLLDETYFNPNWEVDGKAYPFWAKRMK